MNDTFVIVVTVLFAYVHLFNKIATRYFESDRTLTLEDLYHKVIPPTDFHIQV